ncbi:MAG TPA: hypothetical protein VNG53_09460, partial [Bacteroidia bacterium]|nr:hypothetical protein [Bacteroidia bacterium]
MSGGYPFVINLNASFSEKKHFGFLGRHEGIPFYFCQKTPYRENNLVLRNLRKATGLFNAFIFISRFKKKKNIKVLFFSINFFNEAIIYLYLKILGIPILRECNEAPLFIRKEKKFLRLHTFFHTHLRLKMYNGIIVISDYLYKYYSAIYPKNKIFQIPILVDLDRFNNLLKKTHDNIRIITYVGSMGGD